MPAMRIMREETKGHINIAPDLRPSYIWIGRYNAASAWLQISGNVHFAVHNYPNKFQRLLCKWFLGWRFIIPQALELYNSNKYWDIEI